VIQRFETAHSPGTAGSFKKELSRRGGSVRLNPGKPGGYRA
jgi:hypothetical protein